MASGRAAAAAAAAARAANRGDCAAAASEAAQAEVLPAGSTCAPQPPASTAPPFLTTIKLARRRPRAEEQAATRAPCDPPSRTGRDQRGRASLPGRDSVSAATAGRAPTLFAPPGTARPFHGLREACEARPPCAGRQSGESRYGARRGRPAPRPRDARAVARRAGSRASRRGAGMCRTVGPDAMRGGMAGGATAARPSVRPTALRPP